MIKILTAAALAALVASPAMAKTYPSSLARARAQFDQPVRPGAYDYYGDSHYGGGAPGTAGMFLGRGTANTPGGIIGGGPGAYQ